MVDNPIFEKSWHYNVAIYLSGTIKLPILPDQYQTIILSGTSVKFEQ